MTPTTLLGRSLVFDRTGQALVAVEPDAISIVELGAGGVIRFDHDVDDLVVDPRGHRLAVRSDTGAIELHQLADLLRRPVASIQAASESEPPDSMSNDQKAAAVSAEARAAYPASEPGAAAPAAPEPDAVVSDIRTAQAVMSSVPESRARAGDTGTDPAARRATAELRAPFVCPALTALDPRTRPTEIDRDLARHQLGGELRTVALWALGAIAAAWDSRKLGYGNEGKHPYELEVGAILGMNRGFAGDYLAAAREQLAEHEHAITSDVRRRAHETPVGAMTDELGLDPLAVDVVLVIAAAALWGEIARLYGILANDAGRATVDELLVQQVLESRHDRHAVAAAITRRGTPSRGAASRRTAASPGTPGGPRPARR